MRTKSSANARSIRPARASSGAWSVFAGLAVMLGACQGLGEESTWPAREPVRAGRTPDATGARGEVPQRALFTAEPDVRVRVAAGVAERTLGAAGRLVARAAEGRGDLPPVLLSPPVSVRSSAAGVYVRDARGEHTFPAGVDVEVVTANDAGEPAPRGERLFTMNAVTYPGTLTLRPAWASAPESFDAVVTMGLESYLPGVLTHELLPGWRRATNEAQAVAARTYALHERGRARDAGRAFDVESTTNDQVYGGATAKTIPADAVRATRGVVMLDEGRVLRAYFSSTCGGRPSSAAKVWPTGPGYEFNLAAPLQGAPREHFCQTSKWYRWQVVRTPEDVSKRLRHWGATFKHQVGGVGSVREARVAARNPAERPVEYDVIDDSGRAFRVTGEELRNALNQPTPGTPALSPATLVRSGDLEMEWTGEGVEIRGRGWGHGVGMCQYCAEGMAGAGMEWPEMVRAFYPGAEATRVYP